VNFLHFAVTSAGGNMYLNWKPLLVAARMVDCQYLEMETVDEKFVGFLG